MSAAVPLFRPPIPSPHSVLAGKPQETAGNRRKPQICRQLIDNPALRGNRGNFAGKLCGETGSEKREKPGVKSAGETGSIDGIPPFRYYLIGRRTPGFANQAQRAPLLLRGGSHHQFHH